MDNFKFYDQGWNARIRGDEYVSSATRDWRDGWKDCDEAIASGEEVKTLD
jgi:hypothetical protein